MEKLGYTMNACQVLMFGFHTKPFNWDLWILLKNAKYKQSSTFMMIIQVYCVMADSILHPNTTRAINPMLDDTIIYAFHKSKTHYL